MKILIEVLKILFLYTGASMDLFLLCYVYPNSEIVKVEQWVLASLFLVVLSILGTIKVMDFKKFVRLNEN